MIAVELQTSAKEYRQSDSHITAELHFVANEPLFVPRPL